MSRSGSLFKEMMTKTLASLDFIPAHRLHVDLRSLLNLMLLLKRRNIHKVILPNLAKTPIHHIIVSKVFHIPWIL